MRPLNLLTHAKYVTCPIKKEKNEYIKNFKNCHFLSSTLPSPAPSIGPCY